MRVVETVAMVREAAKGAVEVQVAAKVEAAMAVVAIGALPGESGDGEGGGSRRGRWSG